MRVVITLSSVGISFSAYMYMFFPDYTNFFKNLALKQKEEIEDMPWREEQKLQESEATHCVSCLSFSARKQERH